MFSRDEYLSRTESFKEEYVSKFPSAKGFAIDGPNDSKEWESSPVKILFLLKETYGHHSDCICMDSIDYNKPNVKDNFYENRTNRHISRLAYGITAAYKSRSKKIKTTGISQTMLSAAYSRAATIEIKKSSNQRWESNDRVVFQHAVESKDFIRWQIGYLNPDVIFCCGGVVSKFLGVCIPEFHSKNEIYKVSDIIVINSEHPSYRGYKVGSKVDAFQQFLAN